MTQERQLESLADLLEYFLERDPDFAHRVFEFEAEKSGANAFFQDHPVVNICTNFQLKPETFSPELKVRLFTLILNGGWSWRWSEDPDHNKNW